MLRLILAMIRQKWITSAFFYARRPILEIAVKHFLADKKRQDEFKNFEKNNRTWLEDYAEFMAIKEHFGNKALQEWEDKQVVARQSKALATYRAMLTEQIQYFKVTQYFFFQQWLALKNYANQRGIKIIGDMPIYVGGRQRRSVDNAGTLPIR